MNNQAKFKLSVLAVAMVCSANVWAGLGRINVRSFLGETFHADIELTGVRSSELETARIGLASPDTFRDLNVDYSGSMSALRFHVVPSARGAVIRVSSATPINDPYLRFVVEAKTSSGRSVREYTVLLDPATYNAPQSKSIVQDMPQYAEDNLSSRYVGKPARPAHAVIPGVVQTRSGSTLRGMAARVKPAGASLEQTMAALVQNNPHAFNDGNPNKLKAGVTLKVPTAGKVKALSADQVNTILHPDGTAPAATPAQPPATAPAAPAVKGKGADVLKLVPPDAAGAQPDAKLSVLEQQVNAREQSLKDAEARIAALEQQLKAMQGGKPLASQPDAVVQAASVPAVEPVVQASAPVAAAPAPKPVVAPKPVAPPPPPPERSWLDGLMDKLPLIGGGVAGVGLLGALGVMISRRRKAAAGSSLQLSAQANNAVLGRNAVGSGPSSVSGGHSFMTNFTQSSGAIDAAEVDPVAEAEVYMAYGRDAQAEEILKDALAKDPSRQEVRQKLLELYAARPDAGNFEKLAREFHVSTDGKGQAWAKVAAMGLAIDPANALYQLAADDLPAESTAAAGNGVIDLDQELFGEAVPEPVAAKPVEAAAPVAVDDPLRAALFAEEEVVAPAPAAESNLMDFDLDAELAALAPAPAAEPEKPAAEPAADTNLLDFDFNLDGLASDIESAKTEEPAVATLELPATAAASDGFESLYEDMVAATPTPAPSPAVPDAPVAAEGMTLLDDPLSTKLDLAKVYLDMGDRDGAREVLQDLVGEAQGSLKEEAQALLTKISS